MNDRIQLLMEKPDDLAAQKSAEVGVKHTQRADKLSKRSAEVEMSARLQGWLNASELRPPSGR